MNNDAPLVSILIPTYNRENMIAECISSALNQTYENLEVIISDNCSTDNTFKICEDMAQSDGRIKLVTQKCNLGPVANWMNCLRMASGSYIKILFSDDLLAPDCIKKMVTAMEDANVAFVFSSVAIGDSISRAKVNYINGSEQYINSRSIYNKIFYKELPVSPCAMLFRASDVKKNLHPTFDSKTKREFEKNGAGPDVMLSILTAKDYKFIYYIDQPLVFFRAHGGSFTISNADNGVNNGYSSAICWHLYSEKNCKIFWGKFIIKYWIKDLLFNRRLVSLNKFLRAHESVSILKDWITVFVATVIISIELPLVLYRQSRRASITYSSVFDVTAKL